MRIHHTPTEVYKVFNYLPCKSSTFGNIKRWFFCKGYHSKSAALSAIKRFKSDPKTLFANDLVWKVVWYPSVFACEDHSVCVYTEDI